MEGDCAHEKDILMGLQKLGACAPSFFNAVAGFKVRVNIVRSVGMGKHHLDPKDVLSLPDA